MSKQDRQGVRKASDLERKYDLGTDYTKAVKIANDAQRAATNAQDIAANAVNIAADALSKIDKIIDGQTPVSIGEVSLLATEWVGSGNLYHQVVSIDGVAANHQVDLTPDVEQLAVFYEKDITFVTENEDGVVTVYVIGQKPTNDYTIQVTITEVRVNE